MDVVSFNFDTTRIDSHIIFIDTEIAQKYFVGLKYVYDVKCLLMPLMIK